MDKIKDDPENVNIDNFTVIVGTKMSLDGINQSTIKELID